MGWISALYKTVRDDPLLTVVVGTIVATAIISVAVKWWRVLRTALDLLATAVRVSVVVIARWLASPITLPRYYLFALAVLCASAIYAPRFWPWWLFAAVALLAGRVWILNRSRAAKRNNTGTVLDPEELAILKFAASASGQPVSLWLMNSYFGWHPLLIERRVEKLAQADMLRYVQGGEGTAVTLSAPGVDFAIVQGWLRSGLLPGAAQNVPPMPSVSVESPTLADEDRDILKFVVEHDGVPVPVAGIRAKFRWSRLLTDQYIDRLVSVGLIERDTAPSGTRLVDAMRDVPTIKITREGVSLAIRLGLLSTAPKVG
jgi:hypothetical protein